MEGESFSFGGDGLDLGDEFGGGVAGFPKLEAKVTGGAEINQGDGSDG